MGTITLIGKDGTKKDFPEEAVRKAYSLVQKELSGGSGLLGGSDEGDARMVYKFLREESPDVISAFRSRDFQNVKQAVNYQALSGGDISKIPSQFKSYAQKQQQLGQRLFGNQQNINLFPTAPPVTPDALDEFNVVVCDEEFCKTTKSTITNQRIKKLFSRK